jgi:hypothetical protein
VVIVKYFILVEKAKTVKTGNQSASKSTQLRIVMLTLTGACFFNTGQTTMKFEEKTKNRTRGNKLAKAASGNGEW